MPEASRSKLFWWVLGAFLVQLALWTTFLIIAHRNPVQEVPLAGASAQK